MVDPDRPRPGKDAPGQTPCTDRRRKGHGRGYLARGE